MKKNLYIAVACTVLVLAAGIFYFLKDEPLVPPKNNQEAKSDAAANITFIGNKIVERENGKILWEITADSSEVNPDANTVKLFNFKGALYRDNGGKIDLTAKEAMFDTKTRDITLTGEIKAVASDGGEFTAAKARYASKDKHIFGSGGITLTKGDVVITGDEIDSDDKMEKVIVHGNAHVVKGGVPQ